MEFDRATKVSVRVPAAMIDRVRRSRLQVRRSQELTESRRCH